MSDGEICDNCQPILVALRDENTGLRVTINSQAGLLGKLRRQDEDVREHAEWERCVRLFKIWQRATGHTRSHLTPTRFKQALPQLNSYEDEMIERAIEGIAYDPFVTRRKNGTEQRHDGWQLLFKSSDHLEEMANRAPLQWKETLAEHAAEVEGRSR